MLLINSLTPCWNTMTRGRPASVAVPGKWREDERGEWDSATGCVVRNQSSISSWSLSSPPCSPPSGEDARDWPGGRIRLTGSERCQAREENPAGKRPFCSSRSSVLCPCSAVLDGSLRCWRRLPCLSTRQHLAHLASKTCPRRTNPLILD